MAEAKGVRRGSQSQRKDESGDRCATCTKAVSDKDSGIQCEICFSWYHAKCVGISEDVYSFLVNTKNVHWYCDSCNQGFAQVVEELGRLKARQESMEHKMNEIMKELGEIGNFKQKIEKIDNSVRDLAEAKLPGEVKKNVEQHVVQFKDIVKQQIDEELNSRVDEGIKKELTGQVCGELDEVRKSIQITKEQADEQRDKERRRNNIILYNVPESDLARVDDRNKTDVTFCLQLFNNCMNVGLSEDDIINVFRLGKRGEDARPLMIQLAGYSYKNLIMESLYKLRHAESKFKGIVVAHDMTKMEREECKRLVAEAKQKSEEDTSGDYIYRVRGIPGKMRVVRIRVGN